MVSGRHGISRCTAAVTSNLRHGSHEPLLFLYPTWARGIASSAAPIITNDAQYFYGGVPFETSPGEATSPGLKDSRRQNRARRPPNPSTTSPSDHKDESKPKLEHHVPNSESVSCAPEPLPRRAVYGIKVRRILGICEQQARKEELERHTRKQRFEQLREGMALRGGSARTVLEDLTRHTLQRVPGSVVRIEVPQDVLPELLFGVQNNIMEIKRRTGSEIDLLEDKKDGSKTRTLSLSGPSVCVETAAAIILTAVRGAMSQALPHTHIPSRFSTKRPNEFGDVAPQTRFILSGPKVSLEKKSMRADTVPVPDMWTPESLHTYVTSLTRMSMPRQLHKALYRSGEDHGMVVAEILDEVFYGEQTLKVMSINTLNEGISYFMKQNQTHFVRDIYGAARMRGMRLNTETFNIMLRGAAKVKDLDTFTTLVKIMLDQGYRPNAGTWLAFLAVLEDDAAAVMAAVAAMKERGLFHEAGVQAKVCNIVAPTLLHSLLNLEEPASFLEFAKTMEKHFTREWLTLSGANQLLKVLGARGLVSECWHLMDYMAKCGVQPDIVSGNIVLGVCCKVSDYQTGVQLLVRLKEKYGMRPDRVTWLILAKHAWESRLFASSRTLWRYGCLAGWVPFTMRARVAKSLKRFFDPSSSYTASALKRLWATNAGAFFITSQRTLSQASTTLAAMPTSEEFEIGSVAHKLAWGIVKKEIEFPATYQPFPEDISDPLDLLNRALAVDIEYDSRLFKSDEERISWLNRRTPGVPRKKRRAAALDEARSRMEKEKAHGPTKEARSVMRTIAQTAKLESNSAAGVVRRVPGAGQQLTIRKTLPRVHRRVPSTERANGVARRISSTAVGKQASMVLTTGKAASGRKPARRAPAQEAQIRTLDTTPAAVVKK